MLVCARCGTQNPAGFRFCGNCAAPLEPSAAESAERRKVVTVLFADVADSTSLGERRDPEAMRAVMGRYFETVRAVLERHGGTVEKFIGDAVMAVFGHPTLHEDDALRATRAAAELRTALAQLNAELEREWGLRIETRIGVNTGQVVAGEPGAGETLVTGDAVNVAARLQTAAAPGETLIGAETYALVRDAIHAEELPALALKGKELPVDAWRLLSVERDTALGRARRLDSPLVGREREQHLLEEAFERATTDRTCFLFTLLGAAGVGKSRLVHEFLAGNRQQALVLRGRCLPYGQGITFWPLAEVVRQAAGVGDNDQPEVARQRIAELCASDEHGPLIAHHVAAAIGLSDETGAGEEIFWAIRRLLELIAAQQPLVLVFDDVHWAEQTFLDLLEHIADWSREAAILLLCIARPELLDTRPAWAGGKLSATTVLLQPLTDDHVERLIGNLLGDVAIAEVVRDRVAHSAEGNPLFVEEFVAMLIDEGQLIRDNGGWTPKGRLETVRVPPTISSLLAARIDRLGTAERHVLERASVVGKVFWRGAVAALAPETARPDVGPSLMALVRKELVRPDRSDFAGDDAFRFRHLLVRDAAYDGLPKQERVLLHERFAGWLERVAGERVGEYEELLGYHLEQAFRYRTELGPIDAEGRSVAERAARRLAAAGLRALERGDMPAASTLLERAAEVADAGDGMRDTELRAEVESGRCEALIELGRFNEARLAIERLRATAHGPRWKWRATRYELRVRVATNPEGIGHETLSQVEAAVAELRSVGDHLSLAEALNLKGDVHYFLGDLGETRAAQERALEHARLAGSQAVEGAISSNLASLAVWDDTPLEPAIARARDRLAWTRSAGRRLDEARVLSTLARLIGMRGRFDEARGLLGASREIVAQLGRQVHLAGLTQSLGMVETMAGDYVAAERALRSGAEELERLGERAYLSSSLAELGAALVEQGRLEEAGQVAERAAQFAGSDDSEAQVVIGMIRARTLLQAGRVAEAEALAGQLIASVDRAGYFISRLLLRERLEPVFRAANPAAAADLLREAIEMARHKHVRPSEERRAARLGELEGREDGQS